MSGRALMQRFERLSIDYILKAITLNNLSIARLKILRERAKKEEMYKIDNIISAITENNNELLEIKSAIERRGNQPSMLPIGFKDTDKLDRETKTESLIIFTWAPLNESKGLVERAKGSMRNLYARAIEIKLIEEARIIELEIDKLTTIGAELKLILNRQKNEKDRRWPREQAKIRASRTPLSIKSEGKCQHEVLNVIMA